jgi:hypothetical protein
MLALEGALIGSRARARTLSASPRAVGCSRARARPGRRLLRRHAGAFAPDPWGSPESPRSRRDGGDRRAAGSRASAPHAGGRGAARPRVDLPQDAALAWVALALVARRDSAPLPARRGGLPLAGYGAIALWLAASVRGGRAAAWRRSPARSPSAGATLALAQVRHLPAISRRAWPASS